MVFHYYFSSSLIYMRGEKRAPIHRSDGFFIKIVNAYEPCTLTAMNGLRIGSKARVWPCFSS